MGEGREQNLCGSPKACQRTDTSGWISGQICDGKVGSSVVKNPVESVGIVGAQGHWRRVPNPALPEFEIAPAPLPFSIAYRLGSQSRRSFFARTTVNKLLVSFCGRAQVKSVFSDRIRFETMPAKTKTIA